MKIMVRVVIGEVVIQVAKHTERFDQPYLMFRISQLKADVCLTHYGYTAHLSLWGVNLVDKIHTGRCVLLTFGSRNVKANSVNQI